MFILKLGKAVGSLIFNSASHDDPKLIFSDIIENKHKSYIYNLFKKIKMHPYMLWKVKCT